MKMSVRRSWTAAALTLAATILGPGALAAQNATPPDSAAKAEERAEARAERRAQMTDEERAARMAERDTTGYGERRAARMAERDTTGYGERRAARMAERRVRTPAEIAQRREERMRQRGQMSDGERSARRAGRAQRGERPSVGPRRSFDERWEMMLDRREDLDAAGARTLAVETLAASWERGSERIDETMASGGVAAACGAQTAAYRAERARLEQTLARGGSADLDAASASLEAMSASLAGCADAAPAGTRPGMSADEREAMQAARERGETVSRGDRGGRADMDPSRMLRRQAGVLETLAERTRMMDSAISQRFGG